MEVKMKKLLSVIVAVIMIASLIPAVVNAEAEDEYVRSGNDGNVIVPYTTGEGITIDGTLAQGEWSETNKLSLEGKKTMKTWYAGEFDGTIDFYYSWGDAGLYMAAVVYDSLIEDGLANENTLSTRFQIALNPAAIICEDYAGLFFSLTPVVDSDYVALMRHNWETQLDDGYFVEGDEGYTGKYTLIESEGKKVGWNLECIIPWAFISSADRYADLDEEDEIELTNFNPKDEKRGRAFCTAQIAYVQCNSHDGAGIASTARTCADGDPSVWTVDSYDLILLFALPGETDRSTETELFKASEVVTTAEETTDAGNDVTTEEETTEPVETEPETTEAATTEGDAVTDAATTAAPTTDKAQETTGGLPTAAIIGIVIAAVVVVAAIVVAVVLGTKKKA